jgi:hypothetical protein
MSRSRIPALSAPAALPATAAAAFAGPSAGRYQDAKRKGDEP